MNGYNDYSDYENHETVDREESTSSYGNSSYGNSSYGENQGGFQYYNTQEETPKRKKSKKSNGLLKKTAAVALAGVLLGGAGAGTFIGVMKATGYEAKLDSAIAASQVKETLATTIPSAASTTGTTSSSSSSSTVADIAESVMPSIVAITNKQVYQSNDYWSYFFYGQQSGQQETTGAGSGIIIGQNDTELLVLTNYHVIEDATTLTVTFIDDNTYDANVKGTSSENDLAVIAVPLDSISAETMSQLKVATLGDSNALRVGDEVVAIGNALGYGQSLTYGHVSALSREVTIDNKTMTLLQTDAAINPGNSGGALLNMNGEVIGINSAKYSDTTVEGMGFAIPVSEAQSIISDLMIQETRTEVAEDEACYLGVSVVDINSSSAKMYNMPEGVYVYTIGENTPAANSDLREKDIMTAINGTAISSKEDLLQQLSYYKGGTTISITLQRLNDGQYEEKTIEVTVGYKKDYVSSTDQSDGQSDQNQSSQGQSGYSFSFPGNR